MNVHYRPDPLSAAFYALSDPTRRAIFARLASGGGECLTTDGAVSGSAQPTISKHLKVWKPPGLIEGGRDAQRRPRRLAPFAMKNIADWIEPFRLQWESRFNNLDAHLANIKKSRRNDMPAQAQKTSAKDRPRNRSWDTHDQADAQFRCSASRDLSKPGPSRSMWTCWWDAAGEPLTVCEIDLRPGGRFQVRYQGPP